MAYEIVEDFFMNRIDAGKIFNFMERSDYLFLYNIQKCIEDSSDEKVYMSELAEQMKLSIIETSRSVKNLEDKGYVSWRTDENKERTFVKLTSKAKEAMARQNEIMEKAYQKILSDISDDEIKQTISTLGKIREIIKTVY